MDMGHPTQRTFHVLIDESVFYEPQKTILAGAIVFETNLGAINETVRALYEELSKSYLEEERSFQKFRDNGFHASDDMLEISTRFVHTISKLYGVKLFIEYSDQSLRPDLSDDETIVLLETRLTETILKKYRRYENVRVIFETNSSLNKHFPNIVKLAARRSGYRGNVTIEIGGKMEPHALSIVDYAIVSYGRQLQPGAQDFHRRNWRAVQPMVSSVRHLDRNTVTAQRGLVK